MGKIESNERKIFSFSIFLFLIWFSKSSPKPYFRLFYIYFARLFSFILHLLCPFLAVPQKYVKGEHFRFSILFLLFGFQEHEKALIFVV